MSQPPDIQLLPDKLKAIAPHLKTAIEFDPKDEVVAYYARVYAAQRGIKIDSRSPECKKFLIAMMDYLESYKKSVCSESSHEDPFSNEIVAQSHIEAIALRIFGSADNWDRNGIYDRKVVKAFYTAGLLFDILTTFGELSEDLEKMKKYGRWKATYISGCVKADKVPVPGPAAYESNEEFSDFNAVPAPTYNVPAANVVAPPARPAPPAQQNFQPPQPSSGFCFSFEHQQHVNRLIKEAQSAMQFDDPATAVKKFQSCINVLTTGKE